jgi:spore maturation protein CgeB
MGAGVCALVNGIDENVATTKGAACLYEKNSQHDLVSEWQRLIDEPDRAAEFAAKGRVCVEQYYRWDAIADQYLAVMSQID